MRKRRIFAVLGMAALAAIPVRAGLILDTVDVTQTPTYRAAAEAVLTFIQVGPNDVVISGFGTFGQMTADGNARWVIFDNTSDPPGPQRLFMTNAVAATATTTNQWYDSPAISFTLQAGQAYYMGLIADQPFVYNYEYGAGATSESANGLTSPVGPNGNATSFDNPTWAGPGLVQQSIRIFAADVPEPGSIALMGAGLVGLAVAMRKRIVARR